MQLPFSEVITIARHLDIGDLRSYLNTGPLDDLHDAETPPPAAVDESGRSAQRFVVDVVVRRRSDTRRISVSGRDIYAVTAPIIVEGAIRLLDGRHRGAGAMAPGEAFDAADVLATLERDTDGLAVRATGPILQAGSVAQGRRGAADQVAGADLPLDRADQVGDDRAG